MALPTCNATDMTTAGHSYTEAQEVQAVKKYQNWGVYFIERRAKKIFLMETIYLCSSLI